MRSGADFTVTFGALTSPSATRRQQLVIGDSYRDADGDSNGDRDCDGNTDRKSNSVGNLHRQGDAYCDFNGERNCDDDHNQHGTPTATATATSTASLYTDDDCDYHCHRDFDRNSYGNSHNDADVERDGNTEMHSQLHLLFDHSLRHRSLQSYHGRKFPRAYAQAHQQCAGESVQPFNPDYRRCCKRLCSGWRKLYDNQQVETERTLQI